MASAVVALGVIAWFALRTPANRMPEIAPTEPAVARTDPPQAAPFLLPFEKPEVRLSMSALTWRGSSGVSNQLLADLKPALDAYRQSNYEMAEREFTALSGRYPQVFEIHFYQGVTRLFVNDMPGAIRSLSAAEMSADATFISDVRWYRAVAEQRAGNTPEAVQRLDALCREKAVNAERACAALEKLR